MQKVLGGINACKCHLCTSGHASSAIRTGRAAVLSGFRQRYITSSTFLYSGLFAAAATYDVAHKKKRRKHWDEAITGLQEDIAAGAERLMNHDNAALDTIPAGRVELGEATDRLQHGTPSREELQYPPPMPVRASELDAAADALLPMSGHDGSLPRLMAELKLSEEPWPLPTNFGVDTEQHRLAPQSIYGRKQYHWNHRSGERPRYSPKKEAMISATTNQLLLSLLKNVDAHGLSADIMPQLSADDVFWLKGSTMEIQRLGFDLREHINKLMESHPRRNESTALPKFTMPQFRTRVAEPAQDIMEVNQQLLNIFDRGQQRTPLLLFSVYQILNEAKVLPDLTTFKILIAGLSDKQQPSLAHRAIQTLRRAHLRLDENLVAIVLRHYTRANEGGHFEHWLRMIQGEHGGLGLARPMKQINNLNTKWLTPKRGRPDKIVQNVRPNSEMFQAMLSGRLAFSGFSQTLAWCQQMASDGWGICLGSMGPLMDDCLQRADIDSARELWGIAEALELKVLEKGERSHTEEIPIRAYAAMLELCRNAGDSNLYWTINDKATNVYGKQWHRYREDAEHARPTRESSSENAVEDAISISVEQAAAQSLEAEASTGVISNTRPDEATMLDLGRFDDGDETSLLSDNVQPTEPVVKAPRSAPQRLASQVLVYRPLLGIPADLAHKSLEAFDTGRQYARALG